jgi:hypothetical protein
MRPDPRHVAMRFPNLELNEAVPDSTARSSPALSLSANLHRHVLTDIYGRSCD